MGGLFGSERASSSCRWVIPHSCDCAASALKSVEQLAPDKSASLREAFVKSQAAILTSRKFGLVQQASLKFEFAIREFEKLGRSPETRERLVLKNVAPLKSVPSNLDSLVKTRFEEVPAL